MKQLALAIGLAALLPLALPTTTTAQAADVGASDVLTQFLLNNPTNSWDVSGYGIVNLSPGFAGDTAERFGGGTRIGYWLPGTNAFSRSVGAALDLSYCDHNWTFASLALEMRGTVYLGQHSFLTLHVATGPGFNLDGAGNNSTVVFDVASGGTLHIDGLPVDILAEYQHVSTSPAQDRVVLGLTKHF